jgi:Ima1 N-terminal domain
MPALFRRQSTVACFFCQSRIIPLPHNLRSFRCPHCQCWNRYDDHGEILSDEPAMHDESLNRKSFAKRGTFGVGFHHPSTRIHSVPASPSKDRLPTVYSKGPFCHTCQTNQMLLVNLLSNYLPPSNVRPTPHTLSRAEAHLAVNIHVAPGVLAPFGIVAGIQGVSSLALSTSLLVLSAVG